ncbi:MAG: hypothetical protein ACOCX4_04580 [Planctomycetota bacterium]
MATEELPERSGSKLDPSKTVSGSDLKASRVTPGRRNLAALVSFALWGTMLTVLEGVIRPYIFGSVVFEAADLLLQKTTQLHAEGVIPAKDLDLYRAVLHENLAVMAWVEYQAYYLSAFCLYLFFVLSIRIQFGFFSGGKRERLLGVVDVFCAATFVVAILFGCEAGG